MNNLFSVFDPQSTFMHLNWLSSVSILLFLPSSYWMMSSKLNLTMKIPLKFLYGEYKFVLSNKSSPGMIFFIISLFMFIFFNNILGLLPYVFTGSSHLVFSLSLALPMWLGYVLYSSFFNLGSFLAHLVPLGTPFALMPLMVIIELISNLIRPLTLSVRLAANMVAGHLILSLISLPISGAIWLVGIIMLFILLTLTFLEMAVAMIQTYVFSTLNILYISEVNYKNLI